MGERLTTKRTEQTFGIKTLLNRVASKIDELHSSKMEYQGATPKLNENLGKLEVARTTLLAALGEGHLLMALGSDEITEEERMLNFSLPE